MSFGFGPNRNRVEDRSEPASRMHWQGRLNLPDWTFVARDGRAQWRTVHRAFFFCGWRLLYVFSSLMLCCPAFPQPGQRQPPQTPLGSSATAPAISGAPSKAASRQAELLGVRMGTWAISVIHASAGELGGEGWRAAYGHDLEKYDEI